MTIMTKTVAGIGLGAALMAAATGSALAHDASVAPDPTGHTFSNAESCTGGAPNPATTTDHPAYPNQDQDADPNTLDGYAADCNPVQGMEIAELGATAHVLASLDLVGINNLTANVINDGTTDCSDTSCPAPTAETAVASFDFPTQTPTGSVLSDTLEVEVTTDSDWALDVKIGSSFVDSDDGSADLGPQNTKPDNTFQVAGEVQGLTSGDLDGTLGVDGPTGLAAAATPVDLDNTLWTNVANQQMTETTSGPIIFVSQAGAPEAGDYNGTIQFRVTAV